MLFERLDIARQVPTTPGPGYDIPARQRLPVKAHGVASIRQHKVYSLVDWLGCTLLCGLESG